MSSGTSSRRRDAGPDRFPPKGTFVIGAMESNDTLQWRIDEAAKFAPLDQLCLSPQCGFSSTVHGNNIAVQAQRGKLRLVVEGAQEVWG